MKLIAGLGNPGGVYAGSRHNIGFSVIKALARGCKIPLKKEKGIPSLSGKGRIKGENVILAMPLTFMNLSGVAVKALLKKYRIGLEGFLVVCDDLDLEASRLKLKSAGSSGGHRGLESIIEALGSEGFSRLRIGIGRPQCSREASRYVLSPFAREEKREIREAIEKAVLCCQGWAKDGITETMNIFNQKGKHNE